MSNKLSSIVAITNRFEEAHDAEETAQAMRMAKNAYFRDAFFDDGETISFLQLQELANNYAPQIAAATTQTGVHFETRACDEIKYGSRQPAAALH